VWWEKNRDALQSYQSGIAYNKRLGIYQKYYCSGISDDEWKEITDFTEVGE